MDRQKQYNEYLQRLAEWYPNRAVLTFEEFCAMSDRWDTEYSAAWKHPAGPQWAVINELETALAV